MCDKYFTDENRTQEQNETFIYLYSDFREVYLKCKFFPGVDIGIMRFFKRLFELVELKRRKGRTVSSVFLRGGTFSILVCQKQKTKLCLVISSK